jgi:hypothetical protein
MLPKEGKNGPMLTLDNVSSVGAPHIPSQKTSKNVVIKMYYNTKFEDSLDLITTPNPPSKNLKMIVRLY